jgi:thiol-disulfide isomerase/thioredoxin
LEIKRRKRGVALIVGAALALAVMSAAAGAPGIGQGAPEFELPGTGGMVKLSDLRGKVVYVDFWASWCGPCKQSFPWLNEMHARYGAQGFEVVGVNVDTRRSDANQFLAQVPARFTLAFDARGETPGRYAAKGMPSSYLVGRDGTIVAMHVGFRVEDKGRIESEIRRALGTN